MLATLACLKKDFAHFGPFSLLALSVLNAGRRLTDWAFTVSILEKLGTHLRNGTLFLRAREKVVRRQSDKHVPPTRPVGDSYYGSRAREYLSLRARQDHWILEQEVVRALLAELPDGLTVLDVPFGTGRFVPYYLGKKMKVFGLDSSADMLEVASCELGGDYPKCHLALGDAASLPYGDDQFDLVVCFRFLSHVVSFDQARVILHEMNRVTKSKAIVQFRVRHADAPSVPPPLGNEAMNDRVNLETLTGHLEEAGFQIVSIEPLEERLTYRRSVFVCDKK